MSRAYRIRIRETLKRVLRAEDHVSTQLELLEILPADEMAALLAAELESRGFKQKGKVLVRTSAGVQVAVDAASGTVTLQAEAEEQVQVAGEKAARVYEGTGVGQQRQRLREELRKDLEAEAQQKAQQLRQQVTQRLESELAEVQAELGQAVNRTTAAALKHKAAQLGKIKELTEDLQTGSLTIVLEV